MFGIEYRIGWRYTRGRKRNRFISFVSLISVLGIAIGATVIITVLSVMNGFKEEIRERMFDMVAHASVGGLADGDADWRALQPLLEDEDGVAAAAPHVELQGMLQNGGRVSGAYLHGVLPEVETRVSDVVGHMKSGSLEALEAGSYRIILGSSAGARSGRGAGRRRDRRKPQDHGDARRRHPASAALHRRRHLRVGVVAIRPQPGAAAPGRRAPLGALARRRGQRLRLRLADLFDAPRVTRRLNARFGPDYWVVDWTRSHANFFRAIELEKLLMLIVMTLIIAVAAFNIISMLVMVVIEKRADIAILKTMGMAPRRIMKIFIVKGCLVGLFGNLLGVAGGVALASHLEALIGAIERATGFKFLSPDVYPITEVPSRLLASDVGMVAALAFVLTVLATIYPAWRAARVRPAEVLGES